MQRMKRLSLIISLIIALMGCNKNTPNPIISSAPNQVPTSNHYSFDIGSFHYSSPDLYGQQYYVSSDTLLVLNAYNNSDTISGGFTLHAPGIGTFTHTNTIGNTNNCFGVSFGNPSMPNSTFYSQSGTLTITTYDNAYHTYAGTFSGIMYLSTNPSYTLALTNGSFYYKY